MDICRVAFSSSLSLCSCVQFLTLVLISVERFLAIAFPFKKRTEQIGIWILFIWVCGLFIAVLSLVMCDNSCYVMCQHLQKSPGSRTARTSSVCTCCFPSEVCLILIIIHYFRIFSVVRQHTNKITDTGVQFRPYFGNHLPSCFLDREASSAAALPQKSYSASVGRSVEKRRESAHRWCGVFSDPSGPRAGQEEARGPRGEEIWLHHHLSHCVLGSAVYHPRAEHVRGLQTETSD